MGQAKKMMMQHEDDVNVATSYLVKIDELKECEAHGEIYGGDTTDWDSNFYSRVMADRKRGVNGPIPWAASMPAREFTDLLNEAANDHCGDGCGYCAKNMAE